MNEQGALFSASKALTYDSGGVWRQIAPVGCAAASAINFLTPPASGVFMRLRTACDVAQRHHCGIAAFGLAGMHQAGKLGMYRICASFGGDGGLIAEFCISFDFWHDSLLFALQ
ncbi:hypothetical protein V8J88_25205 [Massilia sp. W12]|uniref:hypothetical protein n=1 Tax=Massilia sp. W12 TaxID=3126507 RepID=UPI0030CEFD3A